MKEFIRRITALILAANIMVSCVPLQVFAEDEVLADDIISEEHVHEETELAPEIVLQEDEHADYIEEIEKIEVKDPVEENQWIGKSAVFVGDSITAGTGTTKIYYQYLKESLGLSSITAMGVGGSCVSAYSDYGQNNQPLINRYQNIPSSDLIVIFIGTNDYGHETPLGSVSDTQDGTFYGALNTIVPALKMIHPKSKIVFVTSLHRYGRGSSKILGTKFTYDNIPNGVGASLEDYVNALKTVCEQNDISVIDLYNECSLDPSDSDIRSKYIPDGIHPNADGHKIIAEIMESHILEYTPSNGESISQTELIYGNKFASGFTQMCRASTRVSYYFKAGTVITFKNSDVMQWACAKTPDESGSKNLGYFPDSQWTDKEIAVVEEDGWVSFVFKYRDETQIFDLSKPLSEYITIKEPHSHTYQSMIIMPTCTEQGYTIYTCTVCGDSYKDNYTDITEHTYSGAECTVCGYINLELLKLEGKTLSILGASISTYAGTSNGVAADTTNSTIRNNVKYYPNTVIPEVTLNDTWWIQLADDFNLRLLVNNAWSGSAIFLERSGTKGAYVDRCVQLHDNTGENAGEEPDIICIQMGFNDFSYGKSTLGNSDIDYDKLITEDGYGTPSTTMEATAIMLDKIKNRYPNAEIYMLNHFKRIGQSRSDTKLMEELNTSIEAVCSKFDVTVVDLYSRLTSAEYIGDGKLHPNRLGMDVITEAFKNEIIANSKYGVETHRITANLDGVTADYIDEKIVVNGDSFTLNLSVTKADKLIVKVVMGGKDITSTAYSDGVINISSVTGDVTVTAKAEHIPQEYTWTFNGTDLESTGEINNPVTRKSGTTTDGVFNNTRYELDVPVVLEHDKPWSVEWKSEGTFKNESGSSGARVFTSDNVNAHYNARYIFKSCVEWLIAMGEKDTAGSHNYGIALADYGIDGSAPHIYRLQNIIESDGTNMIYLYVDGKEIGAMDNYYIGTVNQNKKSDWLSGKDFTFKYMGTDTHGFTNAKVEYIKVFENGEKCSRLNLQYDDHYDVTGKTVEIINAGTPVSYKSAGVLDESVISLENNYLIASGIGEANIRIDGQLYTVNVQKAKINIVTIMGQSNAGNHFANATSDVTCPIGTAYWWGNGNGINAKEPVDYTEPSMGFHTPLLAELYAQSVASGDPVKNVMVWQEGITSKNGQSIVKWAASETNTSGTDDTVKMIKNCVDYYEAHSDK